METASTERQPTLWWLALPLAAGAVLRLANLRGQVLGGDELHSVRVMLQRPVSEILFTYQRSDHCLPLTAIYRLLADSGVTMTEMVFRLPVLLCGLLIIVVLPLLAARYVGCRAALAFAWLLAVSPVMIFYSRIVRSYAPVVLLVFCALLFFYAWWRGRGWYYGLLFAFFSALALYFHLGAGPVIAAPWLFAAGELLVERRWRGGGRPGLPPLLLVGAVQALFAAAFLVPARESLDALVGAKRIEQSISFAAVGEAMRILSGSGLLIVIILFWGAAVAGLIMLLRRNLRFGLFSLTVIVVHLAGLSLLSPYGIKMAHVLGRYMLPVLPFVLLCVALASSSPWPGDRGGRWKPAATAALVLLLVLGGPLTDGELLRSSFVHNNDYLYFASAPARLDPDEAPAFYRRLGGGKLQPGPLVEYPWTTVWNQSQALYLYQRVHGQPVLVGALDALLDDPRIEFRNMPRMETGALLASRARYLVVHFDWAAEEAGVAGGRWIKKRVADRLARVARRLVSRLGRDWGPPVYRDATIMVWDLEGVRNRAGGRQVREKGKAR